MMMLVRDGPMAKIRQIILQIQNEQITRAQPQIGRHFTVRRGVTVAN
jgi:hypothetical protein